MQREGAAPLSGQAEQKTPMVFGMAGYAIVRATAEAARREVIRITDVQQSAAGYKNYQQWIAGSKLEQKISLEDYSVSNRGLRSGLVGTPDQVKEQIAAFEEAGVELLLLQSSPQLEEMERFAGEVMGRCAWPNRASATSSISPCGLTATGDRGANPHVPSCQDGYSSRRVLDND